jgi:hypothetical protein
MELEDILPCLQQPIIGPFWNRWFQSAISKPVSFIYILISSSLPLGQLPSGFLTQILYEVLSLPYHFIDLISIAMFGEEYILSGP